MPTRAWVKATAEHGAAVAAFLDLLQRLPPDRWHERQDDARWSHAEEALHVALTYEICASAIETGASMRLRVSPMLARVSRTLLLPLILRTGRFPRGVMAPREVRPPRSEADACTPDDVADRLQAASALALRSLREGEARRPPVRLGHAYFGPIPPLTTLRLLSAHTRHHAHRLGQHAAPARER